MNTEQTNIKEQPSYYAILTADVRYSKVLKPNEKLLFAEITALTNMNGQCFATNKYFAGLYDVSIETVSRWVSHLEKLGFIKRTIKYKQGSKQIDKRFISLATPIDEKINTPHDNKVKTPIDEKVKGNTTSFNSSFIENFYPNETSILAVSDKYGSVVDRVLHIAVQEFKDAATNKTGEPYNDLQSAFRNYVRKDWLVSFKATPQTHAQMRGKVIQAQTKPNLDKLAMQKSMKKLEQANG